MGSAGYLYIYLILPALGVIVYTSTNVLPFLQGALRVYVNFFSIALLYHYAREGFLQQKELLVLSEQNAELEKQKIKQELENTQLREQELAAQKEKLQYEYAFLRAQINPHFLHNTLNMLFSDALNYSPQLAENILKLSSIMRYSMEALEFDSGKVSIEKELEQLQTLIDINNLRFSHKKSILYIVEGKPDNHKVPPLSLITIVENAFKYGDLSDSDHPLTIKVSLMKTGLCFYCSNKIKKNSLIYSSNNIGITNLSKRLDVAFSGKYQLKGNQYKDSYIFRLLIKK